MLEIKNFSKTYKNGKKAVDNLNLSVKSGDIYGFIGHNGAGKSTTIKAVVGVLEFEEGQILIDGKDIRKEPVACKKEMAYIPDNPDLYEHLTGIQYLSFIGDIFGVPGKERKERIQTYGDMLEITDSLGDPISSYSHGMKQKTALLSAFLHQPRLMVLDEPFVGLDPKASLMLKNAMKEMCSRGGAIFFSTHVLDVAEKLCNQVAIIKGGKLVAAGQTKELTQGKSLEEVFMHSICADMPEGGEGHGL